MNSLDGLRPSVDLEYVLEAETFQKGRRFSRVRFLDGLEERQNVVKRIVRLSPDTTQDYFCQEETMVLKVSGGMYVGCLWPVLSGIVCMLEKYKMIHSE